MTLRLLGTSSIVTALALITAVPAASGNVDDGVRFPSVDCRADYGPTADAICGSRDLRSLDRQVAALTSDAYAAAGWWGRHTLKVDQRRFLADRDNCRANEVCLVTVLSRRVDTVGVRRWQ